MNTIEVFLKQADVTDRWNRAYPLEELVKLCNSINNSELPPFGEFSASQDSLISLERVSHSIIAARMDHDKLMVTLKILPTPLGNVLKQLHETECTISARMRGTGRLDMDENGVYRVSDYSLLTVDIDNGQDPI